MALEHTVTAGDVATAAGLRGDTAAAKATEALELAVEELEEALAGAWRLPGPKTLNAMVLRVAVDGARATKANGNAAQSTQLEDGQQVRAPRDPLAGVRTRLARYVVSFG